MLSLQMPRRYLWQAPSWPNLIVDDQALGADVDGAVYAIGAVAGALAALRPEACVDLERDAWTETAIQTSAIEGQVLSVASVHE
ncbi:MAG: DUF4172 domain-containing protein, partial [Candidatus Eremiobacteraeota bacterium]|nr:DUF4172 domain-containing protein [Candidatus Eremiobacteraeota bacterium]